MCEGSQKVGVLGSVGVAIGLLSSGGPLEFAKIAEPDKNDGYVLPNHRRPERKLKKGKKK